MQVRILRATLSIVLVIAGIADGAPIPSLSSMYKQSSSVVVGSIVSASVATGAPERNDLGEPVPTCTFRISVLGAIKGNDVRDGVNVDVRGTALSKDCAPVRAGVMLSKLDPAVIFLSNHGQQLNLTEKYFGLAVVPLLHLPENWKGLRSSQSSEWLLSYLLLSPDSYRPPDNSNFRFMSATANALIDLAGWNEVISAVNVAFHSATKTERVWMCIWLSLLGVCVECAHAGDGNAPFLNDAGQRFNAESILTNFLSVSSYEDLVRLWRLERRQDGYPDLRRLACNSDPLIARKARKLLAGEVGQANDQILCPSCSLD